MDDQVGWGSAALLPISPPTDLAEGETLTVGDRQYWECGHSGWHLMLGWLCGPQTLMRSPDNRDHYWLIVDHATGSTTGRQTMSHDDRLEIEQDQNEYLASVGLPSERPPDYRWFQILPDGCAPEDIHEVANTAIDAAGLTDSRHPKRSVPHIRAALKRLYP